MKYTITLFVTLLMTNVLSLQAGEFQMDDNLMVNGDVEVQSNLTVQGNSTLEQGLTISSSGYYGSSKPIVFLHHNNGSKTLSVDYSGKLKYNGKEVLFGGQTLFSQLILFGGYDNGPNAFSGGKTILWDGYNADLELGSKDKGLHIKYTGGGETLSGDVVIASDAVNSNSIPVANGDGTYAWQPISEGDNLGNHVALQPVNMGVHSIEWTNGSKLETEDDSLFVRSTTGGTLMLSDGNISINANDSIELESASEIALIAPNVMVGDPTGYDEEVTNLRTVRNEVQTAMLNVPARGGIGMYDPNQ